MELIEQNSVFCLTNQYYNYIQFTLLFKMDHQNGPGCFIETKVNLTAHFLQMWALKSHPVYVAGSWNCEARTKQ